MTRKQLKHRAQNMLMQYGQTAFNAVWEYSDCEDLSDDEKEILIKELDKQFTRIEVLFGYEKGSWTRGV